MSSNWKSTTIGELAKVVTKGTTPTTLGYKFESSGVKFVKIETLTDDGRFLTDKFGYISNEANDALERSKLEENDILFTIAGTIGRTAIVTKEQLPANTNQAVAIVRPDTKQVDPRFLRYVLSNPTFTRSAKSKTVQSVQANFSLGELKLAQVEIPSIEHQMEISSILGCLDDKIALIREINNTLDSISEAIFKSWFIDFDVVHQKLNGENIAGLDKEIADLFPHAFEEKEHGVIPIGWSSCTVYDLATYVNGAAYKAFEPNGDRRGLPIVKIAELKAGITSSTAFSDIVMSEKYLINRADILFSWSGNPDTSIDTFVWPHSTALLNQHIFKVIPNNTYERAFVLQALKNLRPIFCELARNKQTTGLGHVTVADMKRLKIVKPTDNVVQAFEKVVGCIQNQIFQNILHTNTLASLRDSLLPRLISGQLSIADSELELTKI